jgi:DME family drug/metabolite transporter
MTPTDLPYLPQLLALTAALLFALSNQLQGVGIRDADVHSAVLVNIGTAAALYWLAAPLYMEWAFWGSTAALWFALVGVFRPPLSMTMSVLSIRTMGPTLASAFASTAPMFATAFAIVLLGEVLTPTIAIGTVAIVAGAIVATLKPAGLKRDWPIWAIGLPLATAAIRAGAHAVTKLGLNELPSPLFASQVGFTVGFIVTAALFLIQRRRFSGDLRAHRWFMGAGLCSSFGIFALNTALQKGTVLTVAPIVAAAPIFTLMLSLVIFRREQITWRTVLAIALVMTGVVLLILK